jgi:nucleoside-diphosphate-sugar epimerase
MIVVFFAGCELNSVLAASIDRVERGPRTDEPQNNLTAVAMTTGQVRLESDGSPWRPLVHIEDISRAFLAVLEAPRELVHDEAFNVGRWEDNVQALRVSLRRSALATTQKHPEVHRRSAWPALASASPRESARR